MANDSSTHLGGQYHNLWLLSHTTLLVSSYLVSPETQHSKQSHTHIMGEWDGAGFTLAHCTISCLKAHEMKSAGYIVPDLQLTCPLRYNELLTADFSTSKHLQYSEYGTGAVSFNSLKHINTQH